MNAKLDKYSEVRTIPAKKANDLHSPERDRRRNDTLNKKNMNDKLQIFYNEESNVNIRTEMVNGEPWFVAKDVAQALGITWNGKTLASIPERWKGMRNFLTPSSGTRGGGDQTLAIINEAALYKLAFRSNKPNADRFANWVAGEVLPSIRRTGSYSGTPGAEREKLPLPKFRPFYDEWKQRIAPYVSRKELEQVAVLLCLSLSHVTKVYRGTSVSARVVRSITGQAMENRKKGVRYPEAKPVCEQMVIEWDGEKEF